MTEKDRILIVDGSNLLFQMFFGMPTKIINRRGTCVQGIVGFVGALLKIIRRTHPTHVLVLFDGEGENFRREENSDYKTNRPDYSELPEDESPFSQLEGIYSALDFLGIKHFETHGVEADDIIAGYALTYGGECEIVISSFDSDFFQLITESVSILRYRGDSSVICTPEWLFDKLGVHPSQYADFKSLTGDTADNIKGADKVGPKTAALLLSQFHTLSGVLDNAENITKPCVRESVLRSKERLLSNYKIIKLDGSAELPHRPDELLFTDLSESSSYVLRKTEILP